MAGGVAHSMDKKLTARAVGDLLPETIEDTEVFLDPSLMGEQAQDLHTGLESRIVGQSEALNQVVRSYQKWLSGMCEPGRPISNMLFLGPTGAGKTRTVEAIAESLMKDSRAVLKIDCAEFQHSHEIAKLIGSPPGYLGHRETHPLLSQEVLNQHHTDKLKLSLVLFDEVEKASDALWNLLLGIMDKGVLTLGDNRRVDFSRAMLFLTGNVGAAEIGRLATGGIGFAPANSSAHPDGRIDNAAQSAARKKFTPEFLNRLDNIIVFKALGSDEMDHILSIELNLVQQRVFNSSTALPFVFRVTAAARALMLKQGVNPQYGARFLKRAIARLLTDPLSNLIASGQIDNGDVIEADHKDGAETLRFRKLDIGLRAAQMLAKMEEYNTHPVMPVTIKALPPEKTEPRVPVDPLRRVVTYSKRDKTR